MHLRPLAASLLVFLILTGPSVAAEIRGLVVSVADGDTLSVLADGKVVKVRLDGVDAPERKQPGGLEARAFATQLAAGKQVRVVTGKPDRYGRTIGTVRLPGGKVLNDELIKAGHAWHYKAYSKSKRLANLEAKARVKRCGIWAGESPIAPWDWRKGKRTP